MMTTLPPVTFISLMRSFQSAAEVSQDESFSDAAKNRALYDRWDVAPFVVIEDEDRGDGLSRIRVAPSEQGRALRDARDWWAVPMKVDGSMQVTFPKDRWEEGLWDGNPSMNITCWRIRTLAPRRHRCLNMILWQDSSSQGSDRWLLTFSNGASSDDSFTAGVRGATLEEAQSAAIAYIQEYR